MARVRSGALTAPSLSKTRLADRYTQNDARKNKHNEGEKSEINFTLTHSTAD